MATEQSSVVLQKPIRPNSEEVQTQTTKLSDTIEKYAARIQEIKEITGGQRTRRKESSPEEVEILKALKDSRNTFQSILREKQSIRDELNKANEERKSLKIKVKELKKEIKFSTVDEIDHLIQELEEQINGAEELSEEQEEQCIHEIKQLVKSKELLKSLRMQIDQVQADDALCDALVKKLKGLDDDLEDCKTSERELSKELEKLRKQKELAEQDRSNLEAEKKECWEIICALRAKKKELSDAFSEKMEQYYALDRQYKYQLRKEEQKKQDNARRVHEDRKKEQQKSQVEEEKIEKPIVKERETKKTQRSRPRASEKENGFHRINPERQEALRRQREQQKQYLLTQEKISTCDHLLNYLTLHKPVNKATENSATPSQSSEDCFTPPEKGMKELHPDKNMKLDGWFAGTGKKTKGKKGKKSVKTTNAEEKKLLHSFQILQVFNELQIPVPNKQSDVQSCIELVQKKKQELQTSPLKTAPMEESSITAIKTALEEPHTDPVESSEALEDSNVTLVLQEESSEALEDNSVIPVLQEESFKALEDNSVIPVLQEESFKALEDNSVTPILQEESFKALEDNSVTPVLQEESADLETEQADMMEIVQETQEDEEERGAEHEKIVSVDFYFSSGEELTNEVKINLQITCA
eukprot:g1761.t1